MTVFVTGVNGQLGHDVAADLRKRNHIVFGSGSSPKSDGEQYVQLDITDRDRVLQTIKEINPDAVIHCAAWTAVDAAEEPENRETVHRINADGTGYLAEAAKAVDAKMVYISTDYVFDGRGTRPWEPDDKCYAPLSVYGKSKLDGELAVAKHLE